MSGWVNRLPLSKGLGCWLSLSFAAIALQPAFPRSHQIFSQLMALAIGHIRAPCNPCVFASAYGPDLSTRQDHCAGVSKTRVASNPLVFVGLVFVTNSVIDTSLYGPLRLTKAAWERACNFCSCGGRELLAMDQKLLFVLLETNQPAAVKI